MAISAVVRCAFDITPFLAPFDVPPTTVTWTDISAYVREVQWRRGKKRLLERYEAGSATIRLRNEAGHFYYNYTSGDYYPDIKPGVWVQIQVTDGTDTEEVFTGHATRWRRQRHSSSYEEVILEVAEPFRFLTRVPVYTSLSAETTLQRYESLASVAGVEWFQSTGTTGIGSVAARSVYGITLLELVREVERSEAGLIHCTREGGIVFRTHDESNTIATYATSQLTVVDGSTPGTPSYVSIERDYSDDSIYNQVTVTRDGGQPQQVSDATSYNAYGRGELDLGVAVSTDAQALSLAQYWLYRFAEPYEQIESVEILYGGADVDFVAACGLELHTRITVSELTVWGQSLSQDYHVEEISGWVKNGLGGITWGVVDSASLDAWVLGTSELGESTRLGLE